jgi:hypothetical protein
MKRLIFGLFLLAIALSTVIVSVKADNYSTVTLTMNPDQSNPVQHPYDAYQLVTINEAMAYFDGEVTSYPNDGLVSLQINDSTSNALVIRTLQTGTALPLVVPAEINTAYLSNGIEGQITSINPSLTTPYVYVSVLNNLATTQNVFVTLNVYDSNGVPISVASQGINNIAPNAVSPGTAQFDFFIPSWAHYGTAHAYVDVFNKWPSQGGVPLAPEKEFTFTIAGGAAFSGTPETTNSLNTQPTENFNMTFRLPQSYNPVLGTNVPLGTYLAWSTTSYYPQQGASPVVGQQSTEFGVSQLADVSGQGQVNFNSITYFVGLYIAYFTQNLYSPQIDFEHTGTIDFNDVLLFVGYYVLAWSN